MSLIAGMLLLAAAADPLAASVARIAPLVPGAADHLVARDSGGAWFSAAPWGGRLVVPETVLAAAATDAERDALVLATLAWAQPHPGTPVLSPLGRFVSELVAAPIEQQILSRRLETPTDIPPIPERPLAVARENVRSGPAPAERAIALVTRHGIGICPLAGALARLGAADADGRLSGIALDARRARRELGLATHGC
jgi:hypothetical protein